jgi:hypothetical protein
MLSVCFDAVSGTGRTPRMIAGQLMFSPLIVHGDSRLTEEPDTQAANNLLISLRRNFFSRIFDEWQSR